MLQMQDHIPNQLAQIYFVKLRPWENPNLHNVERRLIRKEKRSARDRLLWSIQRTDYGYGEWKWNKINLGLELLQKSHGMLTFPNNCNRGKSPQTELNFKEIDHHSLHFGLLHVRMGVVEERQIRRKIKEVEKTSRNWCVSMECYNDKIRRLDWESWKLNFKNDEKEQIHQEMEKLKLEKEDAIESAALGGKMWNSLGSKEDIKQKNKFIDDDLDGQRAEYLKYNAQFISIKEEIKNV
ncbi:hypothetical protein SAY87_030291 [Trapa incisa]|uniref:Uncharacterized protein n=1 Tax=Trapa incisa TaxID=236973 RepID=A0AAN7QJQ6_9MYRT|nr:hypothetical protein SAY87_030291 [Trapa incisa]